MPGIISTLLLLAVLLILASLLQPVARRLALPHSVLVAALGIGLGALSVFSVRVDGLGPLGDIVTTLSEVHVTADAILYVFLPVLLFQTGLTIDLRQMLDELAPILLLAIVAVIVCTLFVGYALDAVSTAGLIVCLMVGAIVSTTDPVAVTGIFRDLGAPRRLSVLVEGESVFNDAAAIALFTVLAGVLTSDAREGVADAAFLFAKAFLGGLVVGFIAAWAAPWLLRPIAGLPLAEVTVTVGLAYLIFILAEHFFQVSGVVAVVTAALVTGSTGRTRLSPASWQHLLEMWNQLGFWASTLIFIIASMVVPRFLSDVGHADVLLLLTLVVAAFAARAVVLWGLLPLLTAARLAHAVDHRFRGVILWGGLRGAVTLALAIAATENPLLSPDAKRFIAVLATGFVIFTLMINATTLRPVIRMLGLDRLGPVDESLRNRAIALALENVADRTADLARAYHLSRDTAAETINAYRVRKRLADADATDTFSGAQQIGVGLIALAAREERLYLEHHAEQVISQHVLARLIASAGRIQDGARSGGLEGYLRAVDRSLAFPAGLRIASLLQRNFQIQRPLARTLADRFEALLIGRMVVEQLIAFTRSTLSPVLGWEVAESLTGMLKHRRQECERAIEALRLQYPDYAGALEERFLHQAALRLEERQYRALLDGSVISQEIFTDLKRRMEADWEAVKPRPTLDLGLRTGELVRRFPMFDGLSNAELNAIERLLRPRLTYPGEVLIRKGERGDTMYLISSGAVEVDLASGPVRLGSGDFFGELALLTNRRRTADVVSIGYSRLLGLAGRDFRQFLKGHPDIRRRIRAVAEERLRQPDETAA